MVDKGLDKILEHVASSLGYKGGLTTLKAVVKEEDTNEILVQLHLILKEAGVTDKLLTVSSVVDFNLTENGVIEDIVIKNDIRKGDVQVRIATSSFSYTEGVANLVTQEEYIKMAIEMSYGFIRSQYENSKRTYTTLSETNGEHQLQFFYSSLLAKANEDKGVIKRIYAQYGKIEEDYY